MSGPEPRAPTEAAADMAAAFEQARPRLKRLAYRMLGSVAEADDMVQEAYLRWHRADREAVRDPAAFLARTVTRLCLDQLKSARSRRETYLGPWLPEPWIAAEGEAETSPDDITYHLMFVLERLSPLERAAFLLHDVFDMDFSEIAGRLDRSEATCRQLASRARKHVRSARPRFPVAPEEGQAIADAFLTASRGGELERLQQLLAEDVVLVSDGGGKRLAVINPLLGRDRTIRFFMGVARKHAPAQPRVLYRGPIDGLPGIVTLEEDGMPQALALDIRDGVIAAIYVIRNPEKLAHLAGLIGLDEQRSEP
ncbi:MAG: sigma-70 family RNA polymerase sigma factor [Alphaproteobacteria bacterium]